MVTQEESIPRKSEAFLKGVDIFYTQFNDINFYIEDEEQENFYFEIFKKLFPNVKLNKIFPLRGKNNVIEKAIRNNGSKKKIFLVDKDFDDLLGTKKTLSNLFYLENYSIENYLLDESSFKGYIMEEKPRIKPEVISDNFPFDECIKSAGDVFYDLTLLHLLVQCKGIRIPNVAIAPERYLTFNQSICVNMVALAKYKTEVQIELNKIDKRLKVESQLKKLRVRFNFHCGEDLFAHIPGKYLVKYFKYRIESTFKLASRNVDSFIFRLSKMNSFSNLDFLKIAVNSYIN